MASAPQFSVGDLVDIKHFGRASVIEVVTNASHPRYGRCLVRYQDGKTYYAALKKLRKLTLSSSRVVVCERTNDYRAAAVHNVEGSDVCLEVGCHCGVTTAMLHKRCAFVVGVDTGEAVVQQARRESPHVRFEVECGFNIVALRALSPSGSFHKVLVDISGKAPLALIAQLLNVYLDAFPQSLIVVKNEALFKHLARWQQQSGSQAAQHPSQPREVPLPQPRQAREELRGEPQQQAGLGCHEAISCHQQAGGAQGEQQHQRHAAQEGPYHAEQPGQQHTGPLLDHPGNGAGPGDVAEWLSRLQPLCELFRAPW